jgi:EpsI family protein
MQVKPRPVPAILILVAMIAAPLLASVLRPATVVTTPDGMPNLQTMIPLEFGIWRSIPDSVAVVNPQQKEVLDRIYSETLSRSYVDTNSGKIIMLSIAYGMQQSKQYQVHLPEICYPAQGFDIAEEHKDTLDTTAGQVPVMRLQASLGNRTEPITYWIRIGDFVVRGGLEQKIVTVREGLEGRVTDGLLFRVSSIGADSMIEFATQDRFVADLLLYLPPSSLRQLIGAYAAHPGKGA